MVCPMTAVMPKNQQGNLWGVVFVAEGYPARISFHENVRDDQ